MSATTFQGATEEQILKGCVSGERKYQHLLYNMLSAKMFSVCIRYAGDYNAAQDLLQEGFVKVFKNIDKFRGEGSFEGWVRRIFVNTAIEHYRKKVNLYALRDSEIREYQYYEESALDTLKKEDILKMIQKLSDGYRTVFNLYIIEGFSHKEIGEIMGISEGTSKSQLARARYLLQKMIIESTPAEHQIQNA